MDIGILPDPTRHRDWPLIEAILKPAAERGGVPVIEENEIVWVVHSPHLIAAATARLTHEGFGEVVLVGGVDHKQWIHKLDRLIGDWMRDEGMNTVRAYGRNGWARVLGGWTIIGECGKVFGYERHLNVEEN